MDFSSPYCRLNHSFFVRSVTSHMSAAEEAAYRARTPHIIDWLINDECAYAAVVAYADHLGDVDERLKKGENLKA